MKKITSLILILVMILTTFTCYAEGIKLNDIESHWAQENIENLISLGIVNGYEDGSFKPDNTLKFEEFIKMITIAALGKEETEEYKELIKDSIGRTIYWYTSYIDLAQEYGYISSKEMNFMDKNMDRRTMAEIIYNVLSSKGELETLNISELDYIQNKFSDLKISDEKILHVAQAGIINGYPDKTFKPTESLTRAEATTVILRILDKDIRTPIELSKELSDFPEPDLEYLYNYPVLGNKTVKETYGYNLEISGEKYIASHVDDAKNYIEMLMNRDYRTIDKPITMMYYPFFEKGYYRTLTYRDWLLYYMNASHEYKGKWYYDLRSNFANNPGIYNAKEIDNWFEYYQDKFIKDTKDNKVVVKAKFYTEDGLFIQVDSGSAVRGVLRFKYESHNDPANIKEELDLVVREEMLKMRELSVSFLEIGEDSWYMYKDYKDIEDFKVGVWYEIGMDIILSQESPTHGIDDIIGRKAIKTYEYIYPIYIKELGR